MFQIPATLGEVVDRFTILQVKKNNGLPVDSDTMDCLSVTLSDDTSETFRRLNEDLYGINAVLFQLENLVRTPIADELKLTTYRTITFLNKLRAEKKAEISTLVGDNEEPKKYD